MMMYPIEIRWLDGTVTTFQSEADHMTRIARCKHEDGDIRTVVGQLMSGCWKCMSTPLWRRP